MPKFETYAALMRIIERQKLLQIRKLSKTLNIKQLEAKQILTGDVAHLTDEDLIRLTSRLILSRLLDVRQ